MHLVDRDRRVAAPGAPRALGHPRRVVPAERRGDRRRPRRCAGGGSVCSRQRIGLLRQQHAVRRRRSRTCSARPAPTRGTNSSQTPAAWRRRIGWRRPSQALKSPTTATRSAFGAQTAKRTPATPSIVMALAPSALGQLEVPAFVEQMQVELAEQRAEGIGILGLLHRARPVDAQQIGRAVGRRVPANRPSGCVGSSRPSDAPVAAPQHLDRLRARQEGADDAARRAVVRAEHGEGIAVPAVDQRLGVARPSRRRGDHAGAQRLAAAADAARRGASRPCSGMASQAGRLAAS